MCLIKQLEIYSSHADKSEINPMVLLSETVNGLQLVTYDQTEIHKSERY